MRKIGGGRTTAQCRGDPAVTPLVLDAGRPVFGNEFPISKDKGSFNTRAGATLLLVEWVKPGRQTSQAKMRTESIEVACEVAKRGLATASIARNEQIGNPIVVVTDF